VYVLPVAPTMFEQLAPPVSQRRHWYVNVIGWVPDQVPWSAVRVSPWRVVPEIVGRAVFRGAVVAAAAEPAPTSRTTMSAIRRLSTFRKTPFAFWIAPRGLRGQYPAICRENPQNRVKKMGIL
jgi:hypothetical protein